MATINDILKVLDSVPELVPLLERMVALEEAEIERFRGRALEEWEKLRPDGLPQHFDIDPRALGVRSTVLDPFTRAGIIELAYRSRSHMGYLLTDRELAKRALAAFQERGAEAEEDGPPPSDLFQVISGHEHAKRLIMLALAAPRPVHVLLVGDPATAKTLFLEELRRLPKAIYADGALATKAGIVQALLLDNPHYLLLDQVDHLPPDDQQALLGVMATGRVARLRYRGHEDELRLVWVFGTANDATRLSWPLRDRFLEIGLQPYTQEEFAAVCQHFLVKRERVDAEMARTIAEELAPRTRSIRAAQRVARLARDPLEVQEILKVLEFPEDPWSQGVPPTRGSSRRGAAAR